MTENRTELNQPELSAAALSEWNRHVEHVMRGIAHALNNRAAALSAVLELSSDPAEDNSIYSTILGTELERVNDLVATVRSIGWKKPNADAFVPADAAAEARTVIGLHAECRDRQIAIEASDAPPIRVPRWMFVHALIAFGANAAKAGADARIRIVADGDWAVTRLERGAGESRSPFPLGAYASELALAMGGGPLPDGGGFRVPTLESLRKREGRGG